MQKKITIGIKFCGGCNPRFDRGQAFAKIKEQLSDLFEFETIDITKHYKAVLIIRGCGGCGFEYEGEIADKQFLLSNVDEMPKLIEILQNFK